jgi:DNA-binding MarR family transcriptional regulator
VESGHDGAPTAAQQELASRLRLAVARLFRQLKQTNPGELSLSHWSALAALDEVGSIRNTDLAALENLTPTSMTRIIASLEAQGLVARQSDPGDRRSSRITVTPAGRSTLESARTLAAATLARRLSQLPPKVLAQLDDLLPVLEVIAESLTTGDRRTGSHRS